MNFPTNEIKEFKYFFTVSGNQKVESGLNTKFATPCNYTKTRS